MNITKLQSDKKFTTTKSELETLEKHVSQFRKMHYRLMGFPIESRQQFIEWCKLFLGCIVKIVIIRDLFRDNVKSISSLFDQARYCLSFNFSSEYRESGSPINQDMRPRYSIDLTQSDLNSIRDFAKRISAINSLMNEIGVETVNEFENKIMSDYKSFKPFWFHGATSILSFFLRYVSDKPNDTLPNIERVFGLVVNFDNTELKTLSAMLKVADKNPYRILKPARTRSVLNYSIKSQVLKSQNQHWNCREKPILQQSDTDKLSRFNLLSDKSLSSFYGKNFTDVLGSTMYFSLKLKTKFLRETLPVDKISTRWVKSYIGVNRSSNPTIITGKPERLELDNSDIDIQFYIVPCQWMKEQEITTGQLIVARGYSDCYHCDPDQNPIDIVQPLIKRILLDQNRIKDIRKNKADTLRKCRALNSICLKDSYDAGNCRAGTLTFISQLKLGDLISDNGCIIDCRELASRWRKSGYYQLQLFSNVITIKSANLVSNDAV